MILQIGWIFSHLKTKVISSVFISFMHPLSTNNEFCMKMQARRKRQEMKYRFDKHTVMHNKLRNMNYWVILLEFKCTTSNYRKKTKTKQGFSVDNQEGCQGQWRRQRLEACRVNENTNKCVRAFFFLYIHSDGPLFWSVIPELILETTKSFSGKDTIQTKSVNRKTIQEEIIIKEMLLRRNHHVHGG